MPTEVWPKCLAKEAPECHITNVARTGPEKTAAAARAEWLSGWQCIAEFAEDATRKCVRALLGRLGDYEDTRISATQRRRNES